MLGLHEYGIFVIVVSTVDLIARLFDFQVGQMTTAFASDSIDSDPHRTIGIAQFSYLLDLGAGIAGFLIITSLAPLAAALFLDGAGWYLFGLYGFTVFATTTETTSIALLQLTGRFGAILRLTLLRELMRVTLVVVALQTTHSIEGVIVGLLIMELTMAALWGVAADRAMRARLGGVSLTHRSYSATRGMRREMASMVVHTNVVSYVKVLAAQGPTLLLGAMKTPAEAGLFKIGPSIAAIVGKPADPAWAAVMPRLARLRAAGRTTEMRTLIRRPRSERSY